MYNKVAFAGALFAGSAVAGVIQQRSDDKPETLTTHDWAGIVNFADGIVEVSGDITIPACTPGVPYTTYSQYTTDGWVGLNGWTLPPTPSNDSKIAGLLQTGITCSNDAVYHPENYTWTRLPARYRGWTEYYPNPPIYFNNSDFEAGDVVHARVTKLSEDSGSTLLKNHRTGKEYKYEYTQQERKLLYQTNAEWITETETYVVEGLGLADGILTSNFTEWKFDNAQYRTQDAVTHLAGAADPIECILNGTKIAEGEWIAPGQLVIKNTTPANFTLQIG